MLTFLLLIAIIWLLWTIHQDLMESNDRQRSLKTALTKLANRFEQTLDKSDGEPIQEASTRKED